MHPVVVTLTVFALAVWGLAFWRGGTAERWGAAVVAGNQILGLVFALMSGRGQTPLLVQLSLDGAAAVALLLVLLRFGRPWLGIAMLLYAAQFTLQSVYIVLEINKNYWHFVLNNLNFIAIHLALLVGTIQHWMRSAKAARKAATQ
jgi:hypothetical protein